MHAMDATAARRMKHDNEGLDKRKSGWIFVLLTLVLSSAEGFNVPGPRSRAHIVTHDPKSWQSTKHERGLDVIKLASSPPNAEKDTSEPANAMLDLPTEPDVMSRITEGIEIALNATSSSRKVSTAARMKVFSFLAQPSSEVLSSALILLSCLLVEVNTIKDLPPALPPLIDDMEIIIGYIFAFDFFLRWWAAGKFRLRYLTRPLVIVDIAVVVLPLFLVILTQSTEFAAEYSLFPSNNFEFPFSPQQVKEILSSDATLLNLRLLRILRLQRIVLTDQDTFARFQQTLGIQPQFRPIKAYQLQLVRIILSRFTMLSVVSGLIYTAEHEVNPQIPDYFAALYFGLTTLMGFGDITPVTIQGRFIVGVSMLVGVAFIPAQTASLIDALLELQQDKKKEIQRDMIRLRRLNHRRTTSVGLPEEERTPVTTAGDIVAEQTLLQKNNGEEIQQEMIPSRGTNHQQTSSVALSTEATTSVTAAGDIVAEQTLLQNNHGETTVTITATRNHNSSKERTCKQCNSASHCADALFCCLCGTKL